MAITERGGYKVNLVKIKKMAVASCLYIESWSKNGNGEKAYDKEIIHFKRPKNSAHTPSVKLKYFKRLATKIKNELHDDKRKTKATRIALTTFTDYLGEVREAIQLQTNLKSPTLNADMVKLKNKYPAYSKSFNAISRASAKDLEKIRTRELALISADNSLLADEAYNALHAINVHHPLVRLLAPTKAQSAKRKNKISSNREMRKNNAVTLNYQHITSVIDTCLDSNEFNELAVGVALATGRRAIEVMHVGDFKKSRGKNDVSFAGVAKKFGTGAKHKRHVIPTLFHATRIINAVQKLRETERYTSLKDDVADLSKKQQNVVINRRVAGSLNKTIRSLLGNDSLVFKDSRTIAGNIAVEKIAKQKRYSKLDSGAFRTMYFIHDTYEEAVNYEHIKIDFEGVYKPVEVKAITNTSGLIENADISALEALTSVLMAMPAYKVDRDGKKKSTGMKVVMKLHKKLIETLRENGGFALSVTSIYKGKKDNGKLIRIGGNRKVVQRYMDLPAVKRAITKYHKANNLKTKS